MLFFVKNTNIFINTVKYINGDQQTGLTYNSNGTLDNLINKSTTGDGIPDWEKVLWGLDPTKTENVPGVPDSVTIAKLQQEAEGASSQANTGNSNSNDSTQTSQFSKQFLATIATLEANGSIDENGNMDQTTQDQLTNSLIDEIQNSPQRKIYTLDDVKIVNNNSIEALKKYNTALNNVFPKTTTKDSVVAILQKFAPDDTGNNTDPTVLPELNPIIKQMNNSLSGLLTVPVPQALATLHLYMVNSLEGMIENLNDIEQYNADPIVAFSGMNKYEQNSSLFNQATQYIAIIINMKLNPR